MAIDKIIHYCWFGNNPKSDSVLTYIEGWKRKLPEYKIIEWNESNFNINICKYVREAYEAEKYAFVSDYARLYALYKYGGIYLDTDVEVCKNLEPILNSEKLTFGFEELEFIATSTIVAPKFSSFINFFMESYHDRDFIKSDGNIDETTNVQVVTKMLQEIGLRKSGENQKLEFDKEEINILEQVYFSPFDYINFENKSTPDTYTIHHFSHSWADINSIRRRKLKKYIVRYISKRRFFFFMNYFDN